MSESNPNPQAGMVVPANNLFQILHTKYANIISNLTQENAQRELMMTMQEQEIDRLRQENEKLCKLIDDAAEEMTDSNRSTGGNGNAGNPLSLHEAGGAKPSSRKTPR